MQSFNLLPLREVERRLGLTRWTLYDMIRVRRLPAVKLPSGQYRVFERVVEAFVKSASVSCSESKEGKDAS